ncbi:MAG: SHOCT domain-containing protein [Bacteroidota bacterium]
MFYEQSLGGMNFIWWCVLVILLLWIFVVPFDIPGQRRKKPGPFTNIQMRLATGEIGPEEYHERKGLIEIDAIRHT